MNEYSIVADESVDFRIITQLRKGGYSVYAIIEESPSIKDKEVLEIANQFNALLITEDKDFGELVYRFQLKHSGILLIRMLTVKAEVRVSIVADSIFRYYEELVNAFSVLDDNKLRIRK